jgi:hypothetical protein
MFLRGEKKYGNFKLPQKRIVILKDYNVFIDHWHTSGTHLPGQNGDSRRSSFEFR